MTAPNKIIYSVTVSAPTNIAVIKYWGKADAVYNTPINSSLSVTLHQDDLRAVTTVAASPDFTHDRLWLNGEEDFDAASNKRFRSCVDGVKKLATTHAVKDGTVVSKEEWQQMKVHVSSYNTFPTAAGLASSAAGYAALVAALAKLYEASETFEGELSTIARQGSGSACRSLYGGFVAWHAGSAENQWLDSKAEFIADGWKDLRALICVVSDDKKDTSSTTGMSTSVKTSDLIAHRAQVVVPQRMSQMIDAIRSNDFETFGRLTMQDSNQFHAICLDTYPPIFYMNDISRRIIRLVTAYNDYFGAIKVAYTYDAGPNAVLYMRETETVTVAALLKRYFAGTDEAKGWFNKTDFEQDVKSSKLDDKLVAACDAAMGGRGGSGVKHVYLTKSGPGPQVVTNETNLDPATGLNTYKKP